MRGKENQKGGINIVKTDRRSLDRKFQEGITAMMVGLMVVILGGTFLDLPEWSAAIFIPAGIMVYFIGNRWYRQSYEKPHNSTRGKK